jgi:hypothetical protein
MVMLMVEWPSHCPIHADGRCVGHLCGQSGACTDYEHELAELRAEAENHAKGFLAMIEHGPPARPAHGNERAMAIGFDSDGRRFWCGTDQGLRVYAWHDVLAAEGKDMPDPALAYRPAAAADVVNKGYGYAVAEEQGRSFARPRAESPGPAAR